MSMFDTSENYKNNIDILKKVFKDNSTFNFKYGLSQNQIDNLDEDPVIFGFDIVIHDNYSNVDSPNDVKYGRINPITSYDSKFTSPLINGAIYDFIDYVKISELDGKKEIYDEFLKTLQLFFNDTSSNYRSFKSHYIKKVSGLHALVENGSGFIEEGKQFVEYGKDKITLEVYEDTFLNTGYLAALYKNFTYSKMNGKMLIPENLLKFDMSIIISEVRNFNLVVDGASSLNNSNQLTNQTVANANVFNDNISRYIYTLYDCQFRFPTYSHGDEISNESKEFTPSFIIEIFYKFTTMEMEKFKLRNNGSERKYITNHNINSPTAFNENDTSTNKHPSRPYDIRYNSAITKHKNDPYRKWSKTGDAMDDTKEEFTGIKKVLNNTKKFALTRIRQERDSLINKTLDNIRTSVGLRRISSPINVYDTNPRSIPDYFLGQVRDFANDSVTGVLKKANDKLSGMSKNIDLERLKKGKEAINSGKYSDSDQDIRNASGQTNDVNVYRNPK